MIAVDALDEVEVSTQDTSANLLYLSPDGSHAFSASQDQTVKQWNLKELSEQAHENAHDEPAPSS